MTADTAIVAQQTVVEPTPGVRRSAVVAGGATLALAVLAGAANTVIQGLITDGDATRTATDILAAQGAFRFGVAAFVASAVLDVVIAWALLTFFAPVDRGRATLAAWLRLGYAAVFAAAVGHLAGVIPLLTGSRYPTSLGVDQRGTEALLRIETFHDVWQVGLVLFGLHLTLIGHLAYRSGYVPRVLGVLLVVAGAGYLVDSFGALLYGGYSSHVATYTFMGEALLIPWLLVKGRTVAPRPGPDLGRSRRFPAPPPRPPANGRQSRPQ
jgi:hypothetical protein